MKFFESSQPSELVFIASVKVSWEVIMGVLIKRMVRYYDTFCIGQIVILEHKAFTLIQKLDEILPMQVFVNLVGDVRQFLLYLFILFLTDVNYFQR